MTAVFEDASTTTHNKVTDAILMWTDVGEGDLETMLGRVPWFECPGWRGWSPKSVNTVTFRKRFNLSLILTLISE